MTRGPQPSRRPRVVTLTPYLSYDAVPHAGGRYLLALANALEATGIDQVLLAPDTPSNRAAAGQPGCLPHLLVGPPAGTSLPRRAARRVLAVVDARGRQIDPGLTNLPFVSGLGRPRVRGLLATADVIDLQWSETIRVAGAVRRLAPRARLVGTFHDVQSQLFGRESTRVGQSHPASWRRRASWARRWEQRAVRALDDVVVFSAKDAALLPPGRATIHVVPPPMVPAVPPVHVQPQDPVVLMVSYLAREENDDAARWLLEEIWPGVIRRHPRARLQLAGAGASDDLARLAQRAGADLLGFVDDLASVYASASVAVVPLRVGAGVKFKTIEAIGAGVPVVATPTGAEGAAGPDRLGPLPATAEAFADRLNAALDDPKSAQRTADSLQSWAQDQFGEIGFRRRVESVYGR